MKHQRNSSQLYSTSLRGVQKAVWLFAVALILLFTACAGTYNQENTQDRAPEIIQLLPDSLVTFKAAGEAVFSHQGERHRTDVVTELKNGTDFTCEFYGPFMQPVLSLSIDKDSASVYMEDELHRYGINESLKNIQFFTGYPIIFSDIVRILTGRLVKMDFFNKNPCRIEHEGRKVICHWESDSIAVQLECIHGGKKVSMVHIKYRGERPWQIDCSSFENGLCKQMYFCLDEKNYFSLKYNHIQ